ncbi:kinesin light chain [Grosmannia clavigera kw1407]|uniref:Kinesin light chain n=1 Tax=Grosmannia clavigera (strain kw1407 / UAMH 11150) TaxID=655863 RepID=F0XLI0_GROCL|nr:kinesin light chain [Grosmannia clavigera kw1407]EFX01267.1 kinesin light chain [Grosmannia clavigera kw1407]
MKAWHEPDSPTVDICFIHGLTGHRDKTWTADDSENEPWPKTLLPEKFPEARLLTFGYDADVVRAGVASKSSIKNLADRLLHVLTTDRGPNASHRPLIFIVHSLGGIVCKKAVARSTNDSDETLHSVATSLIGIVFMGTPHDGSGFADLFGLLAPGIRFFKSFNSRLVNVLKRGNELAAEIDNDFWNAWKVIEKDFNAQIEIFCFFEVLPIPGVKTCVVPEKSAIYQQHHSQSIDANHHDMVKFRSADDPGFMSLNHNFVGRENILKDLRQLLFEDKDTHPIVALYGLGGIGKTQVANALAHWTKNHRKECSVFWVPAVSKEIFEKACGAIAKTLGIKCAGNEDIKTLVCDHLSSEAAGEWLLIIDNADDPDLIVGRDTPDSLDQYFPRSDSGRTLVTTRTQSVSQAVAQKTIPLEAFDLPQARQLATKLLERPDMLNDSASMDELLQELEYLPLAISQAMAYIKQLNLSAAEYLKLLRRTNTDRLDLLGKEIPDSIRYKESRHAVATTWLVSFDHLQKASPGAVSLLEFLSQIQPKAIPWSLLPNEKSNAALHNAVLDLCKYSFVSNHYGVLDMHSLVHMAICSWLKKNGRIEMVAISALRHHALAIAYQSNGQI